MAYYEFETVWQLRAPLAKVWDAIVDIERWPVWWRGVERVRVRNRGDAQGVGASGELTWRSRLPYALTFETEVVRIEPMTLIEARANGELSGTGTWRFDEHAGVTSVRYTWRVETTRWWMNLLAPVARPVFRWNHDHLMRSGGAGLARMLEAELLGQE